MSKHRARRSSSRGDKNYVWTAVRVNRVLGLVATEDLLVTDTDWSADGGQRSATVIAIRGYLTFANVGAAAAYGQWYMGVADADIVPESPDLVDTYVDEDIMWTGGVLKSAAGADGDNLLTVDVDVKAKRKIKTGMNLRLIMEASSASEIQVSGIIRTLLLLNAG